MSLPTLPPELWREILRLSVDITRYLDAKWDHPPDLLLWQGWEQPTVRDYFSIVDTKLAIVQVSTAWREMGIELLYEYLQIWGTESDVSQRLSSLISIFERHSTAGRVMKRLDISITAFTPSNIPVLMRLLSLCQNLRTLNISIRRGNRSRCEPSDLLDLASFLQSRFHHSLRRLKLNSNDFARIPDPPLFQYHECLPNVALDTLELGPNTHSAEKPPAIITVSTLTIHHIFRWEPGAQMIPWHFPALRHLSLRGIRDVDIPLYLHFLASNGPQLRSLHISTSGRSWHRLPLLVAPATNLRCLVFHKWHVESFMGDHVFPSIKYIGLMGPSNHLQQDPSWNIPSSVFPNLQCLRFLEISDDRPNWLVDTARKNPRIRFEDKDCRLLV